MKVILTERQVKLLSENRLGYSEEKLSEFYSKGLQTLNNVLKTKKIYTNQIVIASISDIMNESEKYIKLKEEIKIIIEKLDNYYEKLYNIVEMYDFMDRPEVVSKLEFEVVTKIENAKYDFENLFDVLESLIDSSDEIRKIVNP